MRLNSLSAAAAALLPLASAGAQDATRAEDHYYPRPASGDTPKPWLILLPGGGGMDVFGDEAFYFDQAQRWNDAGYDALLVHYQAAAPLLGAEGAPGEMEAKVVADALKAAERNGWLDLECPGFVIGYSMGGAGVMALAADPPANLIGAIGRYPLVRGLPEGYRSQVPMIIFQGEDDKLTTPADLDAFLAASGNSNNIEVIRYPGAAHGFDIPSLVKPVEYNGGTFRYDEESAADAEAVTAEFARIISSISPAEPACSIKSKED